MNCIFPINIDKFYYIFIELHFLFVSFSFNDFFTNIFMNTLLIVECIPNALVKYLSFNVTDQ